MLRAAHCGVPYRYASSPRLARRTPASDLSGLWFRAGAGYAIPLSDVINLVGKGSFGISFNREYIGFQAFAFSLYLEFRG